jgi:U3 small nucleolar RNA-associated protein 7
MAETTEQAVEKTNFNGVVPIKHARTELLATDSDLKLRRRKEAEKAYGRGRKIPLKNIRDKKLRGNLKGLDSKSTQATLKAKDAEILHESVGGFIEPETELERTYKTSQDEIKNNVSITTAKLGFELKLEGGPYVAEYSRNGRDLLLGGRKGHVATMDWRVSWLVGKSAPWCLRLT